MTTLFIEPGSPWENGDVESFIGKMRDELLNSFFGAAWNRRPLSSPAIRATCVKIREGGGFSATSVNSR